MTQPLERLNRNMMFTSVKFTTVWGRVKAQRDREEITYNIV